MKNLLVSVISLLLTFCFIELADAQNLPAGGDRTFEITTSPFSANPVTFNEVRLRMFQSQDRALRIRGSINYLSERTSDEDRDSELRIALAPGMEWHVIQHERVSVFYGAEIPIQYFTTREHGAEVTNKNIAGGEHFAIGANALVGFDIHFLEYFYTGAEVRYGFLYRSYLDAEVDGETFENESSDFMLANSALPRFRLGFRF